jgi:hypothetical protein
LASCCCSGVCSFSGMNAINTRNRKRGANKCRCASEIYGRAGKPGALFRTTIGSASAERSPIILL